MNHVITTAMCLNINAIVLKIGETFENVAIDADFSELGLSHFSGKVRRYYNRPFHKLIAGIWEGRWIHC